MTLALLGIGVSDATPMVMGHLLDDAWVDRSRERLLSEEGRELPIGPRVKAKG